MNLHPVEKDAEMDLAKALSLLDESLASSSGLGMRPWIDRCFRDQGY